MHKLLQRQLRRCGMEQAALPPDVAALLDAVSQAYEQADSDRHLLERSMDLASQELLQGNDHLRKELDLRKEMERQFLQVQKMEAVGRLAGGIAHDFNNLLTIITGYSDLLLQSIAPNDPRHGNLEEVKNAGMRAAGLTRQLLAFSRKSVLQPRVFELDPLMAGLKSMLQRLLGADIDFVVELGAGKLAVCADPGQIEQVIMNLVINARDAMPAGGGLRLRTSVVAKVDALEPWAQIDVIDLGIGMSPEVQSHLFEPFFTTKEVGKGSGLGLSTVYGIVKQSGGEVSVVSSPGQGSTFRVLLPGSRGKVVIETPRSPQNVVARQETVLVAEDEDPLRGLLQTMLAASGYKVLLARNGAEALDVAVRHAGPIHAILTDVVMPGMSGPDLVERVMPLRPGVQVLYMSGYPDHPLMMALAAGGAAILRKPFSAESLLTTLAGLLPAAEPVL